MNVIVVCSLYISVLVVGSFILSLQNPTAALQLLCMFILSFTNLVLFTGLGLNLS